MCSINDSDATYCSEVEELIKATSKLDKSSKNVPVRRSERLSQKLNVTQQFSWNNVRITRTSRVFKTGCILCPSQCTHDVAENETAKVKKCTQDIFSTQDLREDQEILHPEFYCNQYNISLNNNLSCNSKSVKLIKAKKDVPLDLSNKSKVSMRETSQVELDILNTANDLDYCKVKGKIKRGRKPGRPKQICNKETIKEYLKKSTTDNLKSKEIDVKLDQPLTTIQLLAEGNNKDLENHSNINNFNSLILPDIQLKTSKVTHSKRKPRKTCNKTINSAIKSDLIAATTKEFSNVQPKSSNNTNSYIEPSITTSVKTVKNITKPRKTCNKTINSAVKSNVIVPTFKNVQQKSSSNTTSNIDTNKPLISLKSIANSASMESQPSELILPDIQLKTSKVNHSKRKPRKTSNKTIYSAVKSDMIVATTNELSDVQQNSSNNPNSNIEPCKSLIEPTPSKFILKSTKRTSEISISNKNDSLSSKNSTPNCGKRFKSSNENLTTNVSKNQTLKTSKKPAITQKIKILEKLENKAEVINSKIPNYQDILERTLNETNSIKISQKMPIKEKIKYTTVELQDYIQHIKSEPITSSWDIYTKSFDEQKPIKTIQTSLNNSNSNTENINTMETSTTKLHNNTPHIKSVNFTSLDNYPISCGNVKSQSTTAVNKNKHNLKENTEIKIDVISDNLKSKDNPQICSSETQQIKTSQKLRLTRNSQKLSKEHPQNADTTTNELKNQFQYGRANSKSSNGTKKPKTFNSNERNQKLNTNIKTKVTKNYLKSFDKTQFLDKIQSSKIYSQTLLTQDCNYDKSNLMQIPPTPAESTQQDSLKKSILPDVYPPHFKYQLTPGAVLKRSLDAQVITPDDTITSELLESASSSPSLPESLCELLQTKDIKDILNVEKVSYRLYDYHVQALALILNLRIEYLRKMLDKVMKIRPNVLKNIDKAVKMPFMPDCDLFATSPVESWTGSGDVVFNSQSPKQRRMSTMGDGIRC